jgi:hypothetical protein
MCTMAMEPISLSDYLMPYKKYCFMLFQCVFIAGCASLGSSPLVADKTLEVGFSGRGAASGPMMMSAMGPAGIAVGLAIDVGIGKDIQRAAWGDSPDWPAVVRQSFRRVANAKGDLARQFVAAGEQYTIKKIAFKEYAASQDKIFIHLVGVGPAGKPFDLPEIAESALPPLVASLEQLKTDPTAAARLLDQAILQFMQFVVQENKKA